MHVLLAALFFSWGSTETGMLTGMTTRKKKKRKAREEEEEEEKSERRGQGEQEGVWMCLSLFTYLSVVLEGCSRLHRLALENCLPFSQIHRLLLCKKTMKKKHKKAETEQLREEKLKRKEKEAREIYTYIFIQKLPASVVVFSCGGVTPR